MTNENDGGERPKPDAWRKKMDEDEDWTALWNAENTPEEIEFDQKQPLYSSETINNTCRFQEIIRRIETARRKFEARKENEGYKILRELEDELQNLGEVFSGDE